MEKIDYRKKLKELYTASSKKVELVNVPPLQFLMVDGAGDPNHSPEFEQAIQVLFSISYTLKFQVKKGPQQIDYAVMPLEGLWWSDEMSDFSLGNKEKWLWTAMVLQPDFITKSMVEAAANEVTSRKKIPLPASLRMETMKEGLCAQVLHVGPYATETATIQNLHNHVKASGYRLRGKHREIYLNDMRRTVPERLKTIIRQPIETSMGNPVSEGE